MNQQINGIDIAIKPLLKKLWEFNIKTYQSCSGHLGAESFPSAMIWMNNASLDDIEIDNLSKIRGIEQISRIWGREKFPIIEIIFVGETLSLFKDVCNAIETSIKLYLEKIKER